MNDYQRGLLKAVEIAIECGRVRCASRGGDPDAEVFDHGNDHIKAMAAESMACSEQIAEDIRAQVGEEECCEWERPEHWMGMHNTECGHRIDHEKAFVVCPYCGRKIRIKGE